MPLHDDPDMDAELSRTLIDTYVGAADLGEAIATARRVQPGDYAAWYVEWDRSATAAQQAAARAAHNGLSLQLGAPIPEPPNTVVNRISFFDATSLIAGY